MGRLARTFILREIIAETGFDASEALGALLIWLRVKSYTFKRLGAMVTGETMRVKSLLRSADDSA